MVKNGVSPLLLWDYSVVSPFECAIPRLSQLTEHEPTYDPCVDGFDAKNELSGRSVRNLDRSTALLLTSVRDLDIQMARGAMKSEDIGVVVGTSFGSVSTTIRFTQDGLTGDRPYLVNPAKFPNTVMNFAAGQVAIWHGLRGPNATLIAGVGSLFAAMRYGGRLLRSQQASALVIGASEESSSERNRIESCSGGADVIAEGAASFLITDRDVTIDDAAPIAEIYCFRPVHASFTDGHLAGAIASWTIQARAQLEGSDPSQIVVIADSKTAGACRSALGAIGDSGEVPPVAELRLDRYSFGAWSGGIALAAVLKQLKNGQSALLVAADPLHNAVVPLLVRAPAI